MMPSSGGWRALVRGECAGRQYYPLYSLECLEGVFSETWTAPLLVRFIPLSRWFLSYRRMDLYRPDHLPYKRVLCWLPLPSGNLILIIEGVHVIVEHSP